MNVEKMTENEYKEFLTREDEAERLEMENDRPEWREGRLESPLLM